MKNELREELKTYFSDSGNNKLAYIKTAHRDLSSMMSLIKQTWSKE